jgi:hypothetical protein
MNEVHQGHRSDTKETNAYSFLNSFFSKLIKPSQKMTLEEIIVSRKMNYLE